MTCHLPLWLTGQNNIQQQVLKNTSIEKHSDLGLRTIPHIIEPVHSRYFHSYGFQKAYSFVRLRPHHLYTTPQLRDRC